MGLFSHHPSIPEPTITRQLDPNTLQPFHPGSSVTGTFTLTSPIQRPIHRILAAFSGACETRSTRSETSGTGANQTSRTIHYHDFVDLFRFENPLADRPFTAPATHTLTFPFHFVFPAHATPARPEVYHRRTASSGTYDVGAQPLPPSFAWDASGQTFAHVAYRVECVVFFADAAEPYIARFTPLDFTPLPPQPGPDNRPPFVEFVRPAEKYASSRLVGQTKSFRASVRDRFSSATPSVLVTVKASVNIVQQPGAAFPVYLCVELAEPSDPQSIDIPAVTLRVKTLKLERYTLFRSLRERGGGLQPENESTRHDTIGLNAVPESRTVESQLGPEKGVTIFPAAVEARIPGDVTPSFRTVIINHSFRLKGVVEVEVAGKEFEHKFEMGNLTVWPAAVPVPQHGYASSGPV